MGNYFCVTGAITAPNWLLCTPTEVKGPLAENCPMNLPPPTLLGVIIEEQSVVHINPPVVALNTFRVAALLVLVASMARMSLSTTYSAL